MTASGGGSTSQDGSPLNGEEAPRPQQAEAVMVVGSTRRRGICGRGRGFLGEMMMDEDTKNEAVKASNASVALRLRQAGASYEVIAEKLGYVNGEAARDAIIDELERVTRDADVVSAQINIQQLDALLLSLWQEAKQGNPRSVDQVLRILDRREQLEEKLKELPSTSPGSPLEGKEEEVERALKDPELKARKEKKGKVPFGGGHNVPGSTQPGDVRDPDMVRETSLKMRGNFNTWKHGDGSSRLPSLHCNTCQVKAQCVRYVQDSVCLVPEAFRALAEVFGDGTPETVISVLKQKIANDLERMEIGRAAEYARGGKLDRQVTILSSRVEKSLKLLMALYGRYDVVGGKRVVNVTQQNLIVGGEVAQTVFFLLKLPQDRRLEFIEQWRGNLDTQQEILIEAGVDLSGLKGFGGVASSGQVLARLEEALSAPPGVSGRPPGSVEGKGSDEIVDADGWQVGDEQEK